MNEELIEALLIESYTLVGYFGEYPRQYGNCFSVSASDGKCYRILNFGHENLEELIKRNELSFPIKISILSKGYAVIVDGRIPNEWYADSFCESCTPYDLLPAPQRIKQLLSIQRGERTESFFELNGKVGRMVQVNIKRTEPGYIYMPYKIEEVENLSTLYDKDTKENSLYNRKVNPNFYSTLNINKKDDSR